MLFEFDMSMTWRETWYFLFARKRCPACAGGLKRMIRTRDDGFGWHSDSDGLDFKVEYGHKTSASVEYECRRCRVWYPIGQLASRRAD